jgi:hypothetical protein
VPLPARSRLTAAVLLAGALLVAGCGGGSDDGAMPPPQPKPTATAADFPAGKGATIQDLQGAAAEGPVLAPAVSVLSSKRPNRFGFGLFDAAQKQISGAQVAIYTADRDGRNVRGPFLARTESLAVKGAYLSRTTAADPDAAKGVYVADVPFPRRGRHVVTALVKLDGRMLRTNASTVMVDRRGPQPPDVGDMAVRVHTPTLADVGGDASKIDTRTPPATDLLQTDLMDVLGKKPVVLTFATPALCQSRVCGPVVDIVEQVKATAPKDVAFIHSEIYKDNKPDAGVTPAVAAWRLQSEPWTYVIDRTGRVSARFEGAMSAGELERAVAKVSGGGGSGSRSAAS